VLTPETANRVDILTLEQECDDIARTGKDLKLLALPGIEEHRALLLDNVLDMCALKQAEIRAVKDASALRDYKPAAQACSHFIDALDGTADLDRTWRDTVEASCRNNAQPAACRDRHVRDAQKPDGGQRKRLFVLGFGWNNCAVRFMRANVPNPRRQELYAAIDKSIKRQFRIVRSKCQEGD